VIDFEFATLLDDPAGAGLKPSAADTPDTPNPPSKSVS
jgi:hypothetical protein